MKGKLPEYSYRSSAKKEEQIIYRRIGVVVVTTALILFLLFIWGPSLINSVGVFFSRNEPPSNESNPNSNDFIAGPHLEILPVATNSALLDVSGYSQPDQQVELTLNDVLVGKLPTKEDGSFIFEAIRLREAANTLKAVIINSDGSSSQAATATVVYDKTPPKLELIEPVQNLLVGSGISNIRVRGRVDKDTTVTVNGNQVIIENETNFETTTAIVPGENKIKVTAHDSAGNQTTIERTITSQ